MKNPIIISSVNQKGGVHKTTMTLHFGAAMADKGFKVLLVDLDYTQANLTHSLIGDISNDNAKGIMNLIIDDEISVRDVIRETPRENLYIIPSEEKVMGQKIEIENFIMSRRDRDVCLKTKLNSQELEDFDFVIVDNGPTLGLLTINSLGCSDFFLVPTLADNYSIEGISKILMTAHEVREHINEDLDLLGILMVGVDGREKISKEARKTLIETVGDRVFKSFIKVNTKFRSLSSQKKTIFDVSRNNEKGTKEYRDFADEALVRIGELLGYEEATTNQMEMR